MAALTACAHARPGTDDLGEGLASFYGAKFRGRPTASGEIFDERALTAAHRTLPFGTCVRVTVVASGRAVEVRINDRGPFVPGRIIDLSEAAARRLEIVERGVAPVRLERCQRSGASASRSDSSSRAFWCGRPAVIRAALGKP